ncbi:MAG TPA: HAMP domain-containing sensor histidine kinase [Vicinamibacterales bacterium]|nr:HAMP domain-containing sensor histidine kinase [Vicinamibacterales bacterium]
MLLSLASHEFRTPASVVGGYLRMLMRDTESGLNDRQKHMIEEAEKSCARMVALLAEMSDLGKLEAGTAPMSRTDFDLFTAISALAPSVLESSDRGVTLDLRGANSGARLTGDADRIRDAFAALFRAVLREQPASCRVVVDRRVIGPTAEVAIGHEDELDQIWNTDASPFNEHRGGLGLALPIARRVIEHHGGSISSVFVPRPAGPSQAPAGAILVRFELEPRP